MYAATATAPVNVEPDTSCVQPARVHQGPPLLHNSTPAPAFSDRPDGNTCGNAAASFTNLASCGHSQPAWPPTEDLAVAPLQADLQYLAHIQVRTCQDLGLWVILAQA